LQANFRGGKGGTFMVGPGRHLALLRHCPIHRSFICYFKNKSDTVIKKSESDKEVNTVMPRWFYVA